MATYYVEDYEQVTGKKREPETETKVVRPAAKKPAKTSDVKPTTK